MAHGRVAALVLCLGLASPAFASDPSTHQLIFSGAAAAGQNTLSFASNAYTFTFTGDETISWKIDLADPKVAGGMLRIKELSSDSYPIDEGGVIFRDAAGAFSYPISNYKKSVLAGHSMSGGVLTLDYVLNLNGSHPFRYEIRAQGKQLRIRATDPTGSTAVGNNFCGLAYQKSTSVEHPVPIRMQGALGIPITMFRRATSSGTQRWFVANMLDFFQSNGTDYRIGPLIAPVITETTTTYSVDTATKYEPLSNGKLAAPLDDALVIAVSSKIRDVMLDSTAPLSPYRSLLSNRMVFDAPAIIWPKYRELFDLYASLGMHNLAGYFFFDWTQSALDPPGPSSMGPDWAPAFDAANFEAMLHHGTSQGILLGAYNAFNCLPATAPGSVQDLTQVVRDAAGNPKTYFGMGFPLLGVEASGLHAKAESAALAELGANAVYLDIQTYGSISKGPDGGHLDQTANSPWAKTHRQGYAAQKAWFEEMRKTLDGPLLGEGSIAQANANMEWLYYGYVDSVQRCVNTGGSMDGWEYPAGSPEAPTNWPIIPEYEWRVAAKNQVNHGNGFYHRFFGPSDGLTVVEGDGTPIYPLTQDALDLYHAFTITYGHAGFAITEGVHSGSQGYVTHASAAQTYFMTNALQSLYFNTPISKIEYRHNGIWKTFEEVIFATESLESFRNVAVRLSFQNGLKIYVNHNKNGNLAITENGVNYTLPKKTGWWAGLGDWLVAFSAIPPGTNSKRIDYCRATGQYEYFNGRGAVSGYGGITTTDKRSKWRVTPMNLTVTEDAAGKLASVMDLPPGFAGIQILPGDVDLAIGERAGLKAVAKFSNGGLLDVTMLLKWESTKPGVVSVTDSGIVTAKAKGNAKIVAVDLTGSLLSVPVPITVTVP
jgi:hypothetical protein